MIEGTFNKIIIVAETELSIFLLKIFFDFKNKKIIDVNDNYQR